MTIRMKHVARVVVAMGVLGACGSEKVANSRGAVGDGQGAAPGLPACTELEAVDNYLQGQGESNAQAIASGYWVKEGGKSKLVFGEVPAEVSCRQGHFVLWKDMLTGYDRAEGDFEIRHVPEGGGVSRPYLHFTDGYAYKIEFPEEGDLTAPGSGDRFVLSRGAFGKQDLRGSWTVQGLEGTWVRQGAPTYCQESEFSDCNYQLTQALECGPDLPICLNDACVFDCPVSP